MLQDMDPTAEQAHQWLERQNALARAWLIGTNKAKMPTSVQMASKLNEQLAEFREKMDTIASFKDIRFYDVMGTQLSTVVAAGTDLLPLVLSSIFKSSSIAHTAKLPLAIRYNDVRYVKRLMSQRGPKILSHKEPAVDARMLIFAAFNENVPVFKTLNDWGWSLEQLDSLILLEVHQLAQMHLLSEMSRKSKLHALNSFGKRVLKKEDDDNTIKAPLSWIKEQRHKRRSFKAGHFSSFEEHAKWATLSTTGQCDRLQQQWKLLSRERRAVVLETDILRIGWDKLPCLTGWSYRMVHILGDLDGAAKQAHDIAHRNHDSGHVCEDYHEYLGKAFQVTEVKRVYGCEIELKLVGEKNIPCFGRIVSGEDALAVRSPRPLWPRPPVSTAAPPLLSSRHHHPLTHCPPPPPPPPSQMVNEVERQQRLETGSDDHNHNRSRSQEDVFLLSSRQFVVMVGASTSSLATHPLY